MQKILNESDPMVKNMASEKDKNKTKAEELKALAFIIVVLFPLLSVAVVGGYGFIIWMIQAFGGVVGH